MAGFVTGVSSKIAGILGGNIGDAVQKIAGVFKVPPEQVAQHAFELEQIQLQLQKQAMDAATAEITAGAEVIKTEAQSQSWLPRNVRPLLMLFWGVAITLNLVIPTIARFWMPELQPLALDPWVYKLTAIGFTGYTTVRTVEKIFDKAGN